jgi:multicomponent Na+:H+ antiporter subunit G
MLNLLIAICIGLGLFFFLGTSVGLLRFPDFYSRMHAAGKGDTLSSVLMLTGFALYHLHLLSVDSVLVSLKIMLICVFVFIASPTATHAIMDAGYESRVKHWTKRQEQKEGTYDGVERRKKPWV